MRALIVLAACAALCVQLTLPGSAAAYKNCPQSQGGGWHNLTTTGLTCPRAAKVAVLMIGGVRPCWKTERALGRCQFHRGIWTVRGHWFRDRYRVDQLDLRGTASGGRVVHFQTDWDDA